MNTREMMERIARHPAILADTAMQMQRGLPWLEKRNGKLCVELRLYREKLEDGMVLFYPHQYEIRFVYPFEHMAYFCNLSAECGKKAKEPVCRMTADMMADRYCYEAEALYRECDRVLEFQDRDAEVSDVIVEKYQKRFAETVNTLGLEALYA